MPILKSSKKKMRRDKTRTEANQKKKTELKGLLKNVRKDPSKESMTKIFSALDKAVNSNLVHANKAARLKSRLSKKSKTSK